MAGPATHPNGGTKDTPLHEAEIEDGPVQATIVQVVLPNEHDVSWVDITSFPAG